MIKRFTFTAEPDRFSLGDDAPGGGRCLRVAVNAVMAELTCDDPWWNTVIEEWFEDSPAVAAAAPVTTSPASAVVVAASESVMRGAPWVEQRWRDGGEKVKHMAVARRAAGLTPAQFARQWRSHAGIAGGTPIPDAARGHAYVQNHPVPRAAGEWAWDAVNEVYFDGVAGLRARVEWFRANVAPSAGSDLFGESHLIAVREVIVPLTLRK